MYYKEKLWEFPPAQWANKYHRPDIQNNWEGGGQDRNKLIKIKQT